MIKKLKLSLLIAVLSLALVGGSVFAAAGDLTWSAAQTIDLSSPDLDLTIASGSTASSMVVNAGTIVPTLALGDVFTVSTAAAGDFAVSPTTGVNIVCNSNTTSTVTITATGTQAYTITPSATACTFSAGGGGGGGSGTVTDVLPPSNTSVNINSGASTTSVLTVTLTLAATDATQMLVSNDAGFAGASWEGYVTSKSWLLTSGDGLKTVYAKFKDAAGNMSMAVSDTITLSGTGTMAVVTNEPTQGCSGGNLYNTSTGKLCTNTVKKLYNFGTKTLRNGSRGEAVMELQRFLNQFLNLGLVVDGKLGPKTIAVIKKWQKEKGLVADGLIGPKTKAMMNAQAENGY